MHEGHHEANLPSVGLAPRSGAISERKYSAPRRARVVAQTSSSDPSRIIRSNAQNQDSWCSSVGTLSWEKAAPKSTLTCALTRTLRSTLSWSSP